MLTALFVALRIVANPLSNVFQKRLTQLSASPIFIIACTHVLLGLLSSPLLLYTELVHSASFCFNMAICVALAVASNTLLVSALKRTDLSILGPINAFKAVLSLVLGFFLIGESPTATGLGGMLLILAGSFLIVDRKPDQPRHHALAQFIQDRGIQFRFLALGLSATEAVFLKKTLLLSSPITTFVWWAILSVPLALVMFLIIPSRDTSCELKIVGSHWSTYLWLAISTGIMQLVTVITFGQMQVSYALALFQLSSLLSVLFGYRFFKEANIRRRLVGSAIMVVGAVVIILFGRAH